MKINKHICKVLLNFNNQEEKVLIGVTPIVILQPLEEI
jgi:hypothetical protein